MPDNTARVKGLANQLFRAAAPASRYLLDEGLSRQGDDRTQPTHPPERSGAPGQPGAILGH